MRVVSGKVVGGKVVVDGPALDEGTVVTVVAREDDESLNAYFEANEGVAVSLDGLPGLPLPLPPTPAVR